MIRLVDTHTHIQFADYPLPPDGVLKNARQAGVDRLICVGTTLADSRLAAEFAQAHQDVWAAVGVHPHEAKTNTDLIKTRAELAALAQQPKVVAIGECGLDYYYEHSPRKQQQALLRLHLELAVEHNLPLNFHVRDAFKDFWPILAEFPAVRGVVHSFSSDIADLEAILRRDLYVGLNGIMTFTRRPEQLAAAKAVPRGKIVLETDAPFLTPSPYRGTINEPKYVRTTADFLADLRGESLEVLASASTANASALFGLE